MSNRAERVRGSKRLSADSTWLGESEELDGPAPSPYDDDGQPGPDLREQVAKLPPYQYLNPEAKARVNRITEELRDLGLMDPPQANSVKPSLPTFPRRSTEEIADDLAEVKRWVENGWLIPEPPVPPFYGCDGDKADPTEEAPITRSTPVVPVTRESTLGKAVEWLRETCWGLLTLFFLGTMAYVFGKVILLTLAGILRWLLSLKP